MKALFSEEVLPDSLLGKCFARCSPDSPGNLVIFDIDIWKSLDRLGKSESPGKKGRVVSFATDQPYHNG